MVTCGLTFIHSLPPQSPRTPQGILGSGKIGKIELLGSELLETEVQAQDRRRLLNRNTPQKERSKDPSQEVRG